MRSEPLVSVVIPAYRCRQWIGQAIDSALMQNVDLEILVLDDCPEDPLDQVMKAYQADQRIRYIKNEKISAQPLREIKASGWREGSISLSSTPTTGGRRESWKDSSPS